MLPCLFWCFNASLLWNMSFRQRIVCQRRCAAGGNSPVGEMLLWWGESCCVGVTNVFVGLMRNLQAVIIELLGPLCSLRPSSGHGQSRVKPRLKQRNRARQQDFFSSTGWRPGLGFCSHAYNNQTCGLWLKK